MSKLIDIDSIENLPEPLYVMVAGGMGAGKSYVVEHHFNRLPIVDIDRCMEERGYLDYSEAQLAECMEFVSKEITDYKFRKISFVAMGTASNLPVVINRLYQAKADGYKTVLLYIETSVEQALSQNTERQLAGKRGVRKPHEYKIRKTTAGAANTVANLRDTLLVDYFCHYQNIR